MEPGSHLPLIDFSQSISHIYLLFSPPNFPVLFKMVPPVSAKPYMHINAT